MTTSTSIIPSATVGYMATPTMPTPTAGGWSSISKNDQYVKEAAAAAIAQESDKAGHTIKLLAINAAKGQVVAGESYKLSMTVLDNGVKENVTVTVWSQPWLHKETLTSWQETPVEHAQLSQAIHAMASFGAAPAVTMTSPVHPTTSAPVLLATSHH
ncbi:hypothetical protein WS50_27175 [Burkholderia territorii]|nr:hypothetical protein WS47_28570 [Burkholderia territorii]KUZ07313.1 hypothetical protein WS50_27175 [Burkholderia territorii]